MKTCPVQPLLEVQDLSVDLRLAHGVLHAVRNVSFSLNKGEALGVVGESGCGKSMTALALMRLLPKNAVIDATAVRLGGRDLLAMPDAEFRHAVCGVRMAMIFQEPMTSLNPVYSIGRQLTEAVLLRGTMSASEATERAVHLLDKVGIPSAASRLKQYPHQLSGGQRQRVMIAIALMTEPEIIIADEPTTALDVTIQAQILRMLVELGKQMGTALILITHDLGVVSRTVDKVAVMYAGEFVETGTTGEVLSTPRHPYSQGLLRCSPTHAAAEAGRLGSIPGIVPSMTGAVSGCVFANRCPAATASCAASTPPWVRLSTGRGYRCVLSAHGDEVDELPRKTHDGGGHQGLSGNSAPVVLAASAVSCSFTVRQSIFQPKQQLRAVDGVSLSLKKAEVLALVGESGCGKTTLARVMLGLEHTDGGTVQLDGRPLDATDPKDRARRVQPIFQDPYSSLNPRRTIGETIRQPLDVHEIGPVSERMNRVLETMEMVGLPRRFVHNYPSQLSGGQRQRVAIARAIVTRPDILICDEPTSALDVSVQSQILNLLLDLRDELGLTYMIITHDLGVVDFMVSRIAVMYLGQIVEIGAKQEIIAAPRHPYTKALMKSVLSLQPGEGIPQIDLGAGFPNPLDIPAGCRFHPRCPEAIASCSVQAPELLKTGGVECRCPLNS